MNYHSLLLFCLLNFSFIFSNGQNMSITNEVNINENNLLQHIKTLSSDIYEGRRTGTKGGIKAKNYIINQFHT